MSTAQNRNINVKNVASMLKFVKMFRPPDTPNDKSNIIQKVSLASLAASSSSNFFFWRLR